MVPVFTLVAAWFILKERIGNLQKLFMAISVAGMIFINVIGGFQVKNNGFLGFLFILMSAILFAIYNVLVRKLSKNYDTLQAFLYKRHFVPWIAFVLSDTGPFRICIKVSGSNKGRFIQQCSNGCNNFSRHVFFAGKAILLSLYRNHSNSRRDYRL